MGTNDALQQPADAVPITTSSSSPAIYVISDNKQPNDAAAAAAPTSNSCCNEDGMAVTALVLGILGITIFYGLIMGILAITFGCIGRGRTQSINNRNNECCNHGCMGTSGIVLGILCLCKAFLIFLYYEAS